MLLLRREAWALSQGLGFGLPTFPGPSWNGDASGTGKEGPEKIEYDLAQDRVTLQSGGGGRGAWTLKTGGS